MTHKANLIAAATFVVGMAGFQTYAVQLRKEVRGGEPTAVLLVTQDLAPGELLSAENLGAMEVPADYVDARRVLASERGNLLGVALQTPLKAGESLVWSDIADGAAHRHLASLVSPGRRAYSLDSDANPLGGLLRVGDYVDVLLEERGQSTLLLQRVLILAVGTQVTVDAFESDASQRQGGGVTLSLNALQSRELFSAESRGDLRLVLRNSEDLKTAALDTRKEEQATKTLRAAVAQKPQEIEHVH